MILKLFLFWRFFLFALTFLGSIIFTKAANGGIGAITPDKNFDFFASWAQWDGGHFINIARFGYFAPQEYAFFPLLPGLIRITSIFTNGNFVLAALLITNIAFLGFLYVFYKLVQKKFTKKIAINSIFTLISFPTAFFGVAVYSESVFLLLASLTLLCLENKKLYLAILTCALASATRFVGVFLVIPIIWACINPYLGRKRSLDLKVFFLPFSISGLLLYSTYLFLKFKDPFYFLTVESVWQRSFTNPILTIYSYLATNIFQKPINDYLDVISTIGFLIALVFGVKKIPKAWWLYSLLVILTPASSATLTSMPRYVFSAFPVFILIAIFLDDRIYLKIITWGIFLVMQIALSITFVNGHWAA